MKKLIYFAVELMEKQNSSPFDLPSKNSRLNPRENKYIDPEKNITLNPIKNPKINPLKNPKSWKQCQWEIFREILLFEYLTKEQKFLCLKYLKSL